MTITTSNPFSTRFTRPGAIQFMYPDGLSRQKIIAGFQEANWRAEIAGPHGSGKSTLVHDLLPLLGQNFRPIQHVIVRSASVRNFDMHKSMIAETGANRWAPLIIIDGVERLSRVQRWTLKRVCQKREVGLLATVRRPNTWLPTIATLHPQKSTFVRIAQQLQSEFVTQLEADEMEAAFEDSIYDFREAFMSLYDRWERSPSQRRVRVVDSA